MLVRSAMPRHSQAEKNWGALVFILLATPRTNKQTFLAQ